MPLITIDVGINDLNRCSALADPTACLQAGETSIATNLPRILRALRAAAPVGAQFAAMTLYDTYLGKRAAAGATSADAAAFLDAYREANATISADDLAAGFRTADVAAAFDTYNTAPVGWRGAAGPGERRADLRADVVVLAASDQPQHPSGRPRLPRDRARVRAGDRPADAAAGS